VTRPFPFTAGPRTEPPAEYARIRREPGLRRVRLRSGQEALLVTRYADVRLVLSDGRFSRSAFSGGTLFARTTESLPLITTDGAEHGRRRGAVARAFTARRIRQLRPMVEDLAARQLAELAAGPFPADLVAGFTVPFTLRVMCRILGVPDRDLPLFKPWVDPMMSIDRYPAETVARCHRQMHDYFGSLVDAAQAGIDRGQPPPGLIAGHAEPDRAGHPRGGAAGGRVRDHQQRDGGGHLPPAA
jgi:cytochrome P450